MLSLLFGAFLPEIKKHAGRFIVETLAGGKINEKTVAKYAKTLYTGLPTTVKIVSETAFVDFCVKHHDKIFPHKETKPIKKAKAPAKKKIATRKAVKKK